MKILGRIIIRIPLLLGATFLVLAERKVVTSIDFKVLDILESRCPYCEILLGVGFGTIHLGCLQIFSLLIMGKSFIPFKKKQPHGQYCCIMLQICKYIYHLLVWMVMDILHWFGIHGTEPPWKYKLPWERVQALDPKYFRANHSTITSLRNCHMSQCIVYQILEQCE